MHLYLGASTDDQHPTWPSAMLIDRVGPQQRTLATVIHIPTCELDGGVLDVRYHLLAPDLDEGDAVFLIVKAGLVDHADHYYGRQGARRIRLTNLGTGETFVLPYPTHAPSQANPIGLWRC